MLDEQLSEEVRRVARIDADTDAAVARTLEMALRRGLQIVEDDYQKVVRMRAREPYTRKPIIATGRKLGANHRRDR